MEAPANRPPTDVIVHAADGLMVGAFRCPPSHPRFVDSGPIQNDIFVFPRSSVRIRHAGGACFVADPAVATVYNRGQVYDRQALGEDGDRSDWFAVPRAVAVEAVTANGLEPGANGPFSFAFSPVTNQTYLLQRRLFQSLRLGLPTEAIEEAVYGLLDEVVAAGGRFQRVSAGLCPSRDLAEGVRSLVASRFEEEWPLSRLAEHFGVSTFRLCRAFRRATGATIHRYLTTLRLRVSLESLERPAADLTRLALDLGFSSHSHFSDAFGRAFAATPSECRRILAA